MRTDLTPDPKAAAFIERNHRVREAARLIITECRELAEGYEQTMLLALGHIAPGVVIDHQAFIADDDVVYAFFDQLCGIVADETGIKPVFGIELRRREGGRWAADLKMSVPGFDRAIGSFECERKMAAIHIAALSMLAAFSDLIEKAVNRKMLDEKTMRADAEAADAFSERLRLIEESVRVEEQRRARRRIEDDEWEAASPTSKVLEAA